MTDYAARLADPADPLLVILRAARTWGWGRSPSVFMGAPVVTTYTYDKAGRLVRSETVEWSHEDTQMVLALEQYEAGLCPGCNSPIAETTRPEHDPNAFDDPYEELSPPVQCHKCVARSNAARAHEEAENSHALLYTIGLKT